VGVELHGFFHPSTNDPTLSASIYTRWLPLCRRTANSTGRAATRVDLVKQNVLLS